MVVTINNSSDINLETIKRVAIEGESIELSAALRQQMDVQRSKFLEFVSENSHKHMYGITTAHHIGAKKLLSKEDREKFSRKLPPTPPSFGEVLPERLVRAIIVTRLTDFTVGTAPVQSKTAVYISKMLDRPLPKVPVRGMGEPGDIIPLGILFKDLPEQVHLDLGEGMFIINGSPVASAALADIALAGQRRLDIAEKIFALAADAIDSSKQHYDPALDVIWGDPYQAEVLSEFRKLLLKRQTGNLDYQAPVSFRSAPRLLGWARRVQHYVEECAEISIGHASNNPIFIADDFSVSRSKVLSNGGYHDPLVAGSIDSLARAWADLAQLATHQINRLTEKPDGIVAHELEPCLTILYMSAAGWAEEARSAAQVSLISLGPGGQTDTSTPDLLAWNKAQKIGEALDYILAILAVLAAHTIAYDKRTPPPALSDLYSDLLAAYPREGASIHSTVYLEKIVKNFSSSLIL